VRDFVRQQRMLDIMNRKSSNRPDAGEGYRFSFNAAAVVCRRCRPSWEFRRCSSPSDRAARRRGAFSAPCLFCSPQPPPAAAGTDEATKFISSLVDRAINDVIGADIPQGQKEERFRRIVVEAADIPGIAAFVIGREWRSATPEQKQSFVELFQDVSILTWIPYLEEYKDMKIAVTGA
jgi:hypothetical protein